MARRIHYYRSKWWYKQFYHPGVLARRLLTFDKPGTKYKGFRLSSRSCEEESEEFQDFVAIIVSALDLIAQHDPRRYNVIVRTIKVFNGDSAANSLGEYRRMFRTCVINYERFAETHAANNIPGEKHDVAVYYASCIVHEATHGRICSFFVPYNAANREAIERLCRKEEERFLNTLYRKGVYPKVVMKPFDPDKYTKYWKGA